MRIAAALLAVSIAGAAAQPATPPVESVTVTGEKLKDKEIQDFVQSHAATTFRLGKIARWESGLCPVATGLKPEILKFVIQRLKDIAAKVGAPVNTNTSCRSNVEIVFSSNPQAVLGYIRKNREAYLGYHDNSGQADEMAKVTHPIQSWYATGTIDATGFPQVDKPSKGIPYCLDVPECHIEVTNATNYAVTGTRLGDGLHSGIMNVIVAADRDKLVDYEVGALADYIAYLVLAQPRSLDDCEALPSILNLLAAGCPRGATTREISDADIGYLRGLYHMTPDAFLRQEQDQIAYQMKQALGGK
jgi:hypothetical protein